MSRGDASGREEAGDFAVLVCMTCGREYELERGAGPSRELSCEKCGSQVFRRFDDETSLDEARSDFRDETDRDLRPDDPAGDATRGDLHDLNP
jgi:DNA-directed RNA polymerase subunit RPC12/RpoP